MVSPLQSAESDLWVGWDEYHRLIEQLCVTVHESGWKFDQVLCLARGGLRVGDVISRVFDLPLAILSTSSYRAAGGMEQGTLDIASHITAAQGPLGGRVLLVDDLVDSGRTFDRVRIHLTERFASVSEVRSAVIWWKARSTVRPDYFVDFLPSNPWIHQPFEQYDAIRPEQLAPHGKG